MLRVSHGLAPSVTNIPVDALQPLTSMQHLDLSNNKIRSMPENSLRSLKHLQVLKLQDNQIDNIYKGTFQVTSCTFFLVCYSWMTVKLLSEKRYCCISIHWIDGAKCGCNPFFWFSDISAFIQLLRIFIILLNSFIILVFFMRVISVTVVIVFNSSRFLALLKHNVFSAWYPQTWPFSNSFGSLFHCLMSKYSSRYFLHDFVIFRYKCTILLFYSSVNRSCKVLCCLLNWYRIVCVFICCHFIPSQSNPHMLHRKWQYCFTKFIIYFYSMLWRIISAMELKIGKPITTPCFFV
jgi:hypothetical protein